MCKFSSTLVRLRPCSSALVYKNEILGAITGEITTKSNCLVAVGQFRDKIASNNGEKQRTTANIGTQKKHPKRVLINYLWYLYLL